MLFAHFQDLMKNDQERTEFITVNDQYNQPILIFFSWNSCDFLKSSFLNNFSYHPVLSNSFFSNGDHSHAWCTCLGCPGTIAKNLYFLSLLGTNTLNPIYVAYPKVTKVSKAISKRIFCSKLRQCKQALGDTDVFKYVSETH